MRYIILLVFSLLIVACSAPRYTLPPNRWYDSLNYTDLSHHIKYWERTLQEENRKCAFNYPHDPEYQSYIRRHLRVLYLYRQTMELNYHSCWYH